MWRPPLIGIPEVGQRHQVGMTPRARNPRRQQHRPAHDHVPANGLEPTLLPSPAAREVVVGHRMIAAILDASVPGHVETFGSQSTPIAHAATSNALVLLTSHEDL
jgi:hypothetical protein